MTPTVRPNAAYAQICACQEHMYFTERQAGSAACWTHKPTAVRMSSSAHCTVSTVPGTPMLSHASSGSSRHFTPQPGHPEAISQAPVRPSLDKELSGAPGPGREWLHSDT